MSCPTGIVRRMNGMKDDSAVAAVRPDGSPDPTWESRERMPHRPWRPPALVVLLIAGNLLVGLVFTVYLFLGAADDGIIARQLDPGREGNLPTWYASLQWALAAGLLTVYASMPPPGLSRGVRLYLPALGALFLSLDESAALHEWLGHFSDILLPNETRAGTFFWVTGIWMLVLIPLALLAGLLVARLLADHLRAAPRAARLFAGGAFLFVLGAGVLEMGANVVAESRLLLFGLGIAEEVSELMGSSLVVWGAWELLRVSGLQVARLRSPKNEDLPA